MFAFILKLFKYSRQTIIHITSFLKKGPAFKSGLFSLRRIINKVFGSERAVQIADAQEPPPAGGRIAHGRLGRADNRLRELIRVAVAGRIGGGRRIRGGEDKRGADIFHDRA